VRHDEVVAQALALLVLVIGRDPSRVDETQDLIAQGRAALSRIDDPPVATAQLEAAVFQARVVAADVDGALPHGERALVLLERAHGRERPAWLALAQDVAVVRHRIGDSVRAQQELAEVTTAARRLLGPQHPQLGRALSELGSVELHLGRVEDAIAHQREAIEIAQRSLGPEHRSLAVHHARLGRAHAAAAHWQQAESELLRASEMLASDPGPDPDPWAADATACAIRVELVRVTLAVAALERADHHAEQALSICGEQEHDGRSRRSAVLAAVLAAAEVDLARRRYARALSRFGEVIDAEPSGSPDVTAAWVGTGVARLEMGDAYAAVVALERAVVLGSATGTPTLVDARAHFGLARALGEGGMDEPRARALAVTASSIARSSGPAAADLSAAIDAWLDRDD
jgi:eukaryotic-like serine/threonine-protein kinase